MSRSDPTNENRPRTTGSSGWGGGLGLAVGLAVLAIAGVVVLAIVTDDPVVDLDTESSVEDARPAGAGSLPDGDAGLSNDALTNGADDSDFIAPGAPTEATPAPSMEAPDMPETRVAPGEEQQQEAPPTTRRDHRGGSGPNH